MSFYSQELTQHLEQHFEPEKNCEFCPQSVYQSTGKWTHEELIDFSQFMNKLIR